MHYLKIAGKEAPATFSAGALKELTEQYGSMENLNKKIKVAADGEVMDTFVELSECLIRHGVAYANLFCPDITPDPERYHCKDGKFASLNYEQIYYGASVNEFTEMIKGVMDIINIDQEKEIDTKEIKKKGSEELFIAAI